MDDSSSPAMEVTDLLGLSCRFPESADASQFWTNLRDAKDMVTSNDKRWPIGLHGTPPRSGKVPDYEKFDASFFSVHGKQAQKMDPQMRKLLEVSWEAWVDSGVDVNQLRGSNRVGVYIGCCGSEVHAAWLSDIASITGYEQTGCTQSMFANRLSWTYDFRGPSKAVDTACSSSALALHDAIADLTAGRCDYALVGGASSILRPATSVAFNKLHMLSPDGICKSFSADANGYTRADGIAMLVLRRSSLSVTPWWSFKEPYAQIVNIGTNNDGHTKEGITFPSSDAQGQLAQQVCQGARVNPRQIDYVEAHGTGTVVGDGQELRAIDAWYGREAGRDASSPLLIGSVKSNMGHCEGASGLAGVIKLCLSYEHGILPGNLHYNAPNPNCASLHDGTLKVVNETRTWEGGYAALSSFGFGGSNVHMLLHGKPSKTALKARSYNLTAEDASLASTAWPATITMDQSSSCGSENVIPLVSRTPEGLNKLAEALKVSSYGHRSLCQPLRRYANTLGQDISRFGCRGVLLSDSLQSGPALTSPPQVWYVFSGNGSQWPQMGLSLIQGHATFRESIKASAEVAQGLGIDLLAEFASSIGFQDPICSALGLCAVQIALVDVLRLDYGILPSGMLGHSAGEIACGYASQCLTRKQTLEVAFHRGRLPVAHSVSGGLMVATGLSAEQAITRLAGTHCVLACDNSCESTTLSGPAGELRGIAASLQEEGIFARELDTLGLAFHSPALDPLLPQLLQSLRNCIPAPKTRPDHWISTSFEAGSTSPAAAMCSAEYQVHSFRNRVLFTSAVAEIPKDAILLEIGPHTILRSPLRQGRPELSYVSMMRKGECGMATLQKAVADLWLKGMPVRWPNSNECLLEMLKKLNNAVPREIRQAMVSWDHKLDYPMPKMGSSSGPGFSKTYELGGEHAFLADHCIDGRILMPATSYLVTAWEAVAARLDKPLSEVPVRWSDVSIYQAVQAGPNDNVTLSVLLDRSDRFQVLDGTDLIAEGCVRAMLKKKDDQHIADKATVPRNGWPHDALHTVDANAFYRDVARTGINYGPDFRMVQKASTDGTLAFMRWDGCFIRFLDGMLQSSALGSTDYQLRIPVKLRHVAVSVVNPNIDLGSSVRVDIDYSCGSAKTEFCEVAGIELTTAPKKAVTSKTVISRMKWVPYGDRLSDDSNRRQYAQQLGCFLRQKMLPQLEVMDELSQQLFKVKEAVQQLPPTTDFQDPAAGQRGTELLSALQEALNASSDSPIQVLTSMVSSKSSLSHALESDQLLCGFGAVELKIMLDIVMENQRPEGFTACEIGAGSGAFTKQVLSILNSSSASDLVRYTATDSEPVSQVVAFSKLRTEIWSIDSQVPANLKGTANLILGSHAFRRTRGTLQALHNLYSALPSGGFVLLNELVGPMRTCLWGLAQASKCDDEDIITLKDWKVALKLSGFVEVMTLRCKHDTSAMFLYRKCHPQVPAAFKLQGPSLPATCEEMDAFLADYRSATELAGTASTSHTGGEVTEMGALFGRVWVHGTEQLSPGLSGFAMSARKEPKGETLRFVFSTGQQVFASSAEMVENCRELDLFHNMFLNGQNGSYRNLEVDLVEHAEGNIERCHLEFSSYGDLTSLHWVANVPIPRNLASSLVEVEVTYGALNFRDVMLAYGKLSRDMMAHGKGGDYIGLEFSGTAPRKIRVMGVAQNAIATHITTPAHLLWDVPPSWSLAEAATVPVAYTTAYYALVVRGRLRPNFAVLIHSGSGAVGLAAIQICLHRGCQVFTTCGSAGKRDFLLKTFKHLKPENIGDSRSCSFEGLVMKATQGRGVQLVLNSLADDKLQASVRCLSSRGRLLEIGKYDILRGTSLSMRPLLRNIAFDGIDLDRVFNDSEDTTEIEVLHALLQDGLVSGEVKPLPITVFQHPRAEEAFRYMAKGVHIGKCLIEMTHTPGEDSGANCLGRAEQVRMDAEDGALALPARLAQAQCFVCREDKSYVVTGGLGGFGLALAQWLSQQGAKKLLLTSKRGLRTGAQAKVIEQMRATGTQVTVSTLDVANAGEAEELLSLSSSMAPVGGIFHLAMVMADKWLANQTGEGWNTGVHPKAIGGLNLDLASRKLSSLDHFVMFSSIVASAGNEGQCNYGFANSCLDVMCEARAAQGLPALSIQWGIIGHVGFVEEVMQGKMIGRLAEISLPQPVDSCLNVMGRLLCKSKHSGTVMGSFWQPANLLGSSTDASDKDLVTAILDIMGLDAAGVSDGDSLANMGIDSMQLVEVRACIQRALGRPLPLEEIGTMTVGALKALAPSTESSATPVQSSSRPAEKVSPPEDSKGARLPGKNLPESRMKTTSTAEQEEAPKQQKGLLPSPILMPKKGEQPIQISATCGPCITLAEQQEAVIDTEKERAETVIWALMTAVGILLMGSLIFSAARPIFRQAVANASSLSLACLLLILPIMWMAFGCTICLGTVCLKRLLLPVLAVDETIQLWSPEFARWWFVHRAIAMTNALFAKHLRGTALLPVYMRALGARIGKAAFIDTTDFMDLDFIDIGDDVAVGEGVTILAHKFDGAVLKFQKVRVGQRCRLDPFAIATGGLDLPTGAVLNPASSKAGEASRALPKAGQSLLCGAMKRLCESPQLKPACLLSLQLGGLYVNALIITVAAYAGYTLCGFALVKCGLPASLAFHSAAYAASALAMLATPFLLAFLPLLAVGSNVVLTLNQTAVLFVAMPVALAIFSLLTALLCMALRRLLVKRVTAGIYSRQSLAGFQCWISQRFVESAYCHLGSMLLGTWAMSSFYRAFGARVGKSVTFRVGNVVSLPEQLQVGDWVHIGDSANIVTSFALDSRRILIAPTQIHSQALVGVQAVLLPGTTIGEGATLSALSSPRPGSDLQPGRIHMGSPARPMMKAAPSSATGETPETLALHAFTALLPAAQLLSSWTYTTVALTPAAAVAFILSSCAQGATAAGLSSALVTGAAALSLSACGAAVKRLFLGELTPAAEIKKYSGQNLGRMMFSVLETRGDELFGQPVRGSEWWNKTLRSRGFKIGKNVYIDTLWAGDYELTEYMDGAVVDRNATIFAHLGFYKAGVFTMSQDLVTIGKGSYVGPRAAVLPGFTLKSNGDLSAGQIGFKLE